MNQNKQIIITDPVTLQDLVSDAVEKTVKEFKEHLQSQSLLNSLNEGDDIIDIDGASRLTHYSKATIYSYVAKLKIPFFKKDRKLLFSKKALLDWIKNDKCQSMDELSQKAEDYLLNRRGERYGKK